MTLEKCIPTNQSFGKFEPVIYLQYMPTNLALTSDDRMFVCFPDFGDDNPFSLAEIICGKPVPYPNIKLNKRTGDPYKRFVSVQSVNYYGGLLWVLDTRRPNLQSPIHGGPKLFTINLETNEVIDIIYFGQDIIDDSVYLNDFKILYTSTGKFAFITNSTIVEPSTKNIGGILVVNLETKEKWWKLRNDYSVTPPREFKAIVEGRYMLVRERGQPDKPWLIASDGITLSHNGRLVYYCPVSSRELFSVET